jgi:hypothetical protein
MILRGMSVLALGLVAACANPADRPSEAANNAVGKCFFLSQIDGYQRVKGSGNRIIVTTGPRDKYEFETLGSCPYLDDGETIGFDQAGGGTICRGIDVDLIVPRPQGGPPQRCPVRMIRKLSPDEKS